MVKNKTETFFSKYSRRNKNLIVTKLQVNPLCMTKTMCDFFLIGEKNFFFVECKENSINKRFYIERFSPQLKKMKKAAEINKNTYCFLFISFHNFLNSVFYYMVPIEEYEKILLTWHKKSFSILEFDDFFRKYLIVKRIISFNNLQ